MEGEGQVDLFRVNKTQVEELDEPSSFNDDDEDPNVPGNEYRNNMMNSVPNIN